jgi:nucleoid DNA-binding protein
MTIDDIVDGLVKDKRLNRREAADLVETFFNLLKEQVEEGKPCSLPSFGRLKLVLARNRNMGKNCYSEDPLDAKFVRFFPHNKLKARVSVDFDKVHQ